MRENLTDCHMGGACNEINPVWSFANLHLGGKLAKLLPALQSGKYRLAEEWYFDRGLVRGVLAAVSSSLLTLLSKYANAVTVLKKARLMPMDTSCRLCIDTSCAAFDKVLEKCMLVNDGAGYATNGDEEFGNGASGSNSSSDEFEERAGEESESDDESLSE